MSDLPISFFTIVLNGQPFIEYHLQAFLRLPFRWHWHVIEGVAEHHHDTAWGKKNGGGIYPEMHNNGLSNDGTTEYLSEVAKSLPNHVTLYRKPPGQSWDGKLEMCNAPLANINEECLLWQVDCDEIWEPWQIDEVRQMFDRDPLKHSALFRCVYFVGPDLVISNLDCYGNYSSEWLRVWRYQPGDRWTAHEPPILTRFGIDVGKIHPFTHAETLRSGTFHHYAYATEKQVSTKQNYYGYRNALAGWKRLQAYEGPMPCPLRDFFDWVKDPAMVCRAASVGVEPIIQL